MGKTLAALALLAMVGCGEDEAPRPVCWIGPPEDCNECPASSDVVLAYNDIGEVWRYYCVTAAEQAPDPDLVCRDSYCMRATRPPE